MDEADAEEVGPHPIDDGPGEVRVIGRGHPLDQGWPGAGFVLPVRLLAVEEAGLDYLVLSGDLDRAARRRGSPGRAGGVTSVKNAANCQNWVRVHLSKGWLWHWAHSSFTPRNSRAVLPARFSGLNSLAW